MRLIKAHATLFKSIDDSGEVVIDSDVTVLVGQNESGKTAFLQALHKAYPMENRIAYDVVEDYPRKNLASYEEEHERKPATVMELTYEVTDEEINAINKDLGTSLLKSLNFSVALNYKNGKTIGLSVPEKPFVEHLLKNSPLPKEIFNRASKTENLNNLLDLLEKEDLNAESTEFYDGLKKRFEKPQPSEWMLLSYYVWKNYLEPHIPKFLYFDEYKFLPGKVNLQSLKEREQASQLTDEDRTVLALLHLARVDVDDLLAPGGYEKSKARLEGISNSISDKVFRYWTQNQDLEVQFDVKADPNDIPPFNSGNNLYIRIRSQRHRVTAPFDQRSKGFIWFFSFLVWFDRIKQQVDTERDLILLLDEPGLSLHALAQADLLRYINYLAKSHQILYTTHSPFMVHGDRLLQVRTVEDLPNEGTKVSDRISGSDPKTLFPLQAALGYTIAQNLFISKKNLLVEGPADLIFLRYFSSVLDQQNRTSLRDDITIVPVGGLGNLTTFIALLGGNELEFLVLHDYNSKPDPKLESLVRQKLILDRHILHYGMFRNSTGKKGSATPSSDVEDMMSESFYLNLLNKAFEKELGGNRVKVSDLPTSDRLIERIERYLNSNGICLRPSGGFNHYRVANYLASHPVSVSRTDAKTLNAFEELFNKINGLL